MLAVAAACVMLVHGWARTPLLTIVAAVVFVISLWPFYLPVRYRLDASAVWIDYGVWRRRLPWDRFRSYALFPDALVLSPFVSAHPLERFRLTVLPCPENLAGLERYLPAGLVRRGGAVRGEEWP